MRCDAMRGHAMPCALEGDGLVALACTTAPRPIASDVLEIEAVTDRGSACSKLHLPAGSCEDGLKEGQGVGLEMRSWNHF